MSFEEINAAEELMKLAVNNQSHVNSLVGYYRDLIDLFNEERAQWLINFDIVKVTAEDQYLLEKQINNSKQNLFQLQQQLEKQKYSLATERQKYFQLLENNGNIKKRLQTTKSNYRELMNNCKPVGLKNKGINANIKDESMLKENAFSKISQLQNQLINVNKDHHEKKKIMKNKIEHLKEELRSLMSEHNFRADQYKSQYRIALDKLCDLEKKNMAMTSEYFRFRTQNSEEQKYLQEQNQIIRLKNLQILQKLKYLEKSHCQEFKSIDTEVKKQNRKFKVKYDEELSKKQDHLSILKQQHERIQDIYLNKIKKLDNQLKEKSEKLKNTEGKAKVEISSLKSQIKILKGRLEKDGIQEMREELANDGASQASSDSLEVSELERINQEVKNLERQFDSR